MYSQGFFYAFSVSATQMITVRFECVMLCSYFPVMFCVIFLDAASSVLSNIRRLKSDLAIIIEPDFGLLDQLLSLGVLTRPELADVHSERTVYRRNKAMLDLLVSQDQCHEFLKALQRTGQHHVANFISQNGGQKHFDLETYDV